MICTNCNYEWSVPDGEALGNCPECGEDTLLMLNRQLGNPTVERILQNLLLVKGKDILKDKQRLSAMIDDLFSNDQRTMRLLRLSIQEGIPIKLSELYHLKSADLSAKISAFKAQVKENTFCEDKALTKVFQFWTNALNPPKALSTKYEPEDGLWRDNAGVAYSADRKKLWGGFSGEFYKIIKGTKVICDKAFSNHNPSILESSLRGIVIPTSLNLIGDHAFSCCENLQNITIPNSVTSIGFGAFSGCESLREIRIPDSINEIKEHVFAYSGLMSIEIPNSVNSIGSTAFSHSSLSSIKIPKSVISLGSDAFSACIRLETIEVNELNMHYKSVDGVLFDKDLKTIICCPAGKKFKENVFVLPSSVTTIGRGAFFGCSNIESIEIPNSVTKIERDAFKECTNLRIVEIPNSVASIEECTFAECKNLYTITIPDSVNSIKRYAFRACTNLQNVRIQNSVITIEESAFIHCINLQSVRIPNSVTSIGNSAFSGCLNLQSLMLPDSLKSIGNNTFLDCDRLVAIEVNELNMHFASLEGILYDKNLDTLIYCPSGKIFERNVFTVPLSVKTIKSHSFYKCQHLQRINIQNSVISIEEGAFESSSIQSIDLPNSINVIEKDTFKSCENLQSITVPNSVTSIGSSAFINCKNIQRIIISDSVTSIGNYAFCGCENLLSIELPDSISRLEGGTFEGCFNLQNITLPYDLTYFTEYEFLRCHNLRSITIPDYWIRSLFEDENLQSVLVDELPDFLQRIFLVCEKLNQIIINPGLSFERKTIKVIRN